MSCSKCGHKIGFFERKKIAVAMRVFRNAVRKFKLKVDVESYKGQCQKCLLKGMEERVENLKVEVYDELHGEKGQVSADEVKEYIEELATTEARKG